MRAVVRFYSLTFAIAWGVEAIVIAAGGFTSAGLILLYGLGWSSPLLVAAWMVHREGGGAEVRRFLRQLLRWRPTPWHLVAAAAPTLLLSLGGLGATGVLPAWRFSFSVIGVAPPVVEEPGWRGFALPRLQAAWTPAGAALVTGFLWGLWHVPTWFIPGAHADLAYLPVYLVNTAAAGVLIAWLYNEARRLLTVAITFHAAINLALVDPASLSFLGYQLATAAYVVAAAAALLRLARTRPVPAAELLAAPVSGR